MIRSLNQKENTKILASNYIGNLSYIYRDRPYVVPITYFFDTENNIIIGYSGEGHKINAMRKNPNVSLSVSEVDSVNSWNSVLAQGTYVELSGSDAKAQLHIFSLGVKDLVINKEHRKLDFISEFSSKIYKDELPIIFQIKVEEITGKMRRN
ncbi:pyridoxamine 5'-phosphate oxidase family protein [Winogradskyella echinorum]|uniref:Pyridoxamine 5'-phosphate oxidase family protein n=1 Tax=Winogradskyella echinorum TaxID=538189 RepID=A0ABR6Y336_9FLAO|nr:pyridoxamine 5'-phosphate oxidase family protein [Winogradskyella echinorum]MBC3846665.1 pyridoxamine 5'-phosphate oxidase family protein [Winogradskyella echinorum]MBC5751013.1 pyridoxamine 5'-phosphate oxidase family protein [Winogradskyella echinorum]